MRSLERLERLESRGEQGGQATTLSPETREKIVLLSRIGIPSRMQGENSCSDNDLRHVHTQGFDMDAFLQAVRRGHG